MVKLAVSYIVPPHDPTNFPTEDEDASKTTLGIGESITSEVTMPSPITQSFLDDIRDKKVEFVARGIITYKDVFGQSQSTKFRADMLPDGRFVHSMYGNVST